MNIKILVIGLLIIIPVGEARSDDDSFDVESGSVRTMYSGALAPGTLIECEFLIEEAYFGDKWLPMLAISFDAIDQPDVESLLIKLHASRSSNEEGWRHEVLINKSEGRDSDISAYTGETNTVLPMHLWLTDDQYVVFFVGDEEYDMSSIDVSSYSLTRWKVLASGVTGSGDCDSRLLDQDDDE